MLSSGAHVKIGTKEFRLAFGEENAYSYALNSTGEETVFWPFDDWSGGEGNDVYDPEDDNVFDEGLVNPRLPGTLTCPPTRAVVSATPTNAPDRAYTAAAGGRLYVIGATVDTSGDTQYYYTTDFSSLTAVADVSWNIAIRRITAVATDGVTIYLAGYQDGFGSFQIREIRGVDGALSDQRTYANSNTLPIIGMGVLGNFLYYWNGNKLRWRRRSEGTSATESPRTLGSSLTGQTYGTDYWGGMVTGDSGLYFFTATEGRTLVWEIRGKGDTAPFWEMPSGFTGKAISYQSGAVVVVGEYLDSAAAFGMSARSRQPTFLGFVRPSTAVSPEVAGSAFGSEVIFSEKSLASAGKIFVYDIGQDAFSQLDAVTLASGEVWSAGVFGDKRYIAAENGTSLSLYYWSQDDTPSTTVNGRMESGTWDFDLPEDEKQLDGFHVLSDANGTKLVDVYYQDNEDGVWTLAGTATTGFHNYIQVSDATTTVKFRSLRYRVDPKVGAKVFAVSARVRVNTYEETWELLLDLTDESVDEPRNRRRRSHQDKGWQLRDYIRDIADNKAVVTFLDGARYPAGDGDDPDKYSTHTVGVDIPYDRLTQPGEGPMVVRLKSVTAN